MRTRAAAAALSIVAVLPVAGCYQGFNQTVNDQGPSGNGTDLQVLTSNEEGTNPKDFDLMAQATEAGEKVTLKGPNPPSARYVLIWMNGLPQVDGGWRGGVREVRITSS